MRIIGLDVGTKRIGVAKADTSVRIAIPNGYVLVNGQEIPEILRIARLNDTNFFVVGLPRSNDGNETAQSAYARKFADTLAASMPGARIYFQDESLTSVMAEERLKKRKKNFEKGEIDAEAASIILQDFIENYAAKLAQNSAVKIPNQLASPATAISPSFSPAATLGSPEVQSIINEPIKSESESSESPRPAKSSEKPMKKVKRILLSFFILLFLAGLFGGGYYWYSLQPVSSANCRFDSAKAAAESNEKEANSVCEYQTIEVSAGESVKQIASDLKQADLIRNPFAFELYARINARVEKMFQAGLKQEVESLLQQGVSFTDACMKGIGYREWEDFFEGKKSLEEVKEEIQKHSRQFAKRQYTWFHHQMEVEWFENNNAIQRQEMLDDLVRWYQK